MKKIILAYSGGLDTSVLIKWLQEKTNLEVITFTMELGQKSNLNKVEEKAQKLGAKKHYSINGTKEFVKNYIFPAIKTNSLYQGKYPVATALGRPLIAKKLVEIAKKEGAIAVAHGCTGKGNDQVRFDITTTPGCVQTFYNAISRRHINIEETMSCYTETIIILAMEDVSKAFEALTELISEARKKSNNM